jgi:hypothetical protein
VISNREGALVNRILSMPLTRIIRIRSQKPIQLGTCHEGQGSGLQSAIGHRQPRIPSTALNRLRCGSINAFSCRCLPEISSINHLWRLRTRTSELSCSAETILVGRQPERFGRHDAPTQYDSSCMARRCGWPAAAAMWIRHTGKHNPKGVPEREA